MKSDSCEYGKKYVCLFHSEEAPPKANGKAKGSDSLKKGENEGW
jgi:hypothetical protein